MFKSLSPCTSTTYDTLDVQLNQSTVALVALPTRFFIMSETLQELADLPKEFIRDGTQFMNRCTKRMFHYSFYKIHSDSCTADRREFARLCQAIAVGFLIMGAIGYFIKLSTFTINTIFTQFTNHLTYTIVHIPVNNILVGGS